MALAANFQGDVYITGGLTPTTFNPPAGCINDNAVVAGAAIDAAKLQHQHEKAYAQESATTAVSEARVVHVVQGATATLVAFKAGCVVANVGAATVTVNLKKNGTTVLTAVVTLDNSQAAYAVVAAAGFTSTSLVAGDVLEVVFTAAASGGTLGKGAFAQVVLREKAS